MLSQEKRRRFTTAAVAAGLALGMTACGAEDTVEGGEGFPSQDLTVIAAGGPGGGLDTLSRMTKQALEQENLIEVGLDIENMGGGGGNPARAALLERPDDGHTVVAESNRIFLNPLVGTTDMTVDDFQPLAKMTVEYLVWAVNADSKWESAQQVLEAIKENPSSVSFGVGTIPSDDQFNVLRPAEMAGVANIGQLNVVVFEEGGDLTSNLVGGNVDVASTGLSEVLEQVEAGELRLLAISAPPDAEMPEELADVPTWQELGINFELDHWRGFFGPANMPEETVEWWADTLEQATETETWQELVEKYELTTDFEGPEEFAETIKAQRTQAEELVEAAGLGNN
jgi:putative tricarboxylic transport membrane protein